jgi:hypothetical protein
MKHIPSERNTMKTDAKTPFISAEHWKNVVKYLEQTRERLKDHNQPIPDAGLLLGTFGRLANATLAVAPATNAPIIEFHLASGHKQPRSMPPLAFAPFVLLTAFGGSSYVNDDGKGRSYVRLFAGHNIDLLRILCDAKEGQLVRQRRGCAFRNNDPDCFKVTGMLADKPSRLPMAGRKEAIDLALKAYRENQPASRMAITEAEYLSTIMLAFRLLDASRAYPRIA